MALNVEEVIQEDTSIVSQQPFPFNPITGTQYNNAGIIQINIENQAEYFLPSQSWLQIDGQLLKANEQAYAAADNIALVNNAPMYCFSNIKYLLGGNEIESVNEPGQATTMMGLQVSINVGLLTLLQPQPTPTLDGKREKNLC